jgi:hypothetical protein
MKKNKIIASMGEDEESKKRISIDEISSCHDD